MDKEQQIVEIVLSANDILWQARNLQRPGTTLQEVREETGYLAGLTDSLLEMYEEFPDDGDIRQQRKGFLMEARDEFWNETPSSGAKLLEAFLTTFRQ